MIKVLKQISTIIFFLVFILALLIIAELVRDHILLNPAASKNTSKQGIITIINMEEDTDLPINETEFLVINSQGNVVDVLITDKTGRAASEAFSAGTSYTMKQSKIKSPYELNETIFHIEITEENQAIIIKNKMFDFVKNTKLTETGQSEITKLYFPFEPLLQNPELPQGCEITALTSVLHFYGYHVSKTEMADHYLPKEPLIRKNNKLYSANPYKAYAGNPRDKNGGLFSYTPPIVKAANHYFDNVDGNYSVVDLTGSSREDIIEQLNQGVPIMVWVTIDLNKPQMDFSWYFNDTGEFFSAPSNLHVMVLHGYDQNNVYVMDPLKGEMTYDANTFFGSYYALGSHAMMITKENAK
ncbi:C39 family peptidase [Chengkuizengella axinellae]|uniref:C39 family peptidase n=1 Tax=Chengkuizengella axinellae TaxID=3064388 RepID=A0ABT9J0B9_9BACL|nr:C39 family peptidase [Chengkuizengella sp. 2205SS18-9]MDP5275065.1 C39 family peptidase [Chengkuizengella sp. 2205SS18-9]